MNNAQYFKKYQKSLLEIANTEAGKFLLNSRPNTKIVKLSPSAIIYPGNTGDFYCYDRQVKILFPILEKLRLAKENGIKEKAFSSFKKNAEIPFNVVPIFLKNIYVVSGDGGIFGRNAAYATARGLATATGTTNETLGNEFVGGNYEIDRGFFPVLLTDLTRGSVIVSVIANLYKGSSTTTGSDDTAQFAATTQTDPTALALGDYSKITLNSPTSFGTSALWSSMSNGAYTQVTLNAAGRLYMQNNVTTYAKMGLRATNDINAVTPGGRSFVRFSYSNTAGTSEDPFYAITWTGGGGFMI